MNERVYIETTFVGYLTTRPSRDLIVAGHQQITRDWWDIAGILNFVFRNWSFKKREMATLKPLEKGLKCWQR